jgi:hypothetical protein
MFKIFVLKNGISILALIVANYLVVRKAGMQVH